MSLNRYQLRHKARGGHRGARLAESLLERPDRVLGLILLGNNLVNIFAASLVAVISMDMGGQPAVAIGSLIMTLIILIFAETAPKTLAASNPERLAFPASIIFYPLLKITYPLIWLINICSNGVLFLFGMRSDSTALQHLSRDELRTVVHEAGSRITSRYQQMLLGILDLEKVTVDDVMVPHNEIVGIDLDDDLKEISATISSSQHTRLPVYQDGIDNIIGILHLRKVATRNDQAIDKGVLKRLLDEPYFVPEGTPLSTQLVQFQHRRLRIGLVVDEYGDIQGIVTLEDILEEIVGEFTTDPADDGADAIRDGNGNWLVSGTANIRELNREQNWDLPTDGPKTINGLIVEQLETFPDPSTCLKIGGYPIEVIASDNNRIRTVRISTRIVETDDD